MRHPKTIEQRAFDPAEPKWLVYLVNRWEYDHSIKALAIEPHAADVHPFPTIAQACDYARSRVPEEATC